MTNGDWGGGHGGFGAAGVVTPIDSGVIHDVSAILQLEVPVIVRLGERQMSLQEVVNLVPGGIIELPKGAEAELDLLINNKQIGVGSAVKVGENFGIQITYIGDVRSRIEALGSPAPREPDSNPAESAPASQAAGTVPPSAAPGVVAPTGDAAKTS